jgi:hypothetical protein
MVLQLGSPFIRSETMVSQSNKYNHHEHVIIYYNRICTHFRGAPGTREIFLSSKRRIGIVRISRLWVFSPSFHALALVSYTWLSIRREGENKWTHSSCQRKHPLFSSRSRTEHLGAQRLSLLPLRSSLFPSTRANYP